MYASILAAIDLEEPSSWGKSVPSALALARCFGARLTLGTVVPSALAERQAQWSAIAYRELEETTLARLGTLADELRGETSVDVRVASGTVPSGILALAGEVGADLIVLASHRPAMRDWLIGANASRVVRHASCSVMVVRD